jgi:hypothetical protein
MVVASLLRNLPLHADSESQNPSAVHRLLAGGVLQQGVDFDDIGAPIRELPHAGRSGADANEIEHGEAGQGLRSAR